MITCHRMRPLKRGMAVRRGLVFSVLLGLAATAQAQYAVPVLQNGYPNPFCPTTNRFNGLAAYTPGGGGLILTNQRSVTVGRLPMLHAVGQTIRNHIAMPIVPLTSQYGIGDVLPRPLTVPSDAVPLVSTNQGTPNCVQWMTFSNTNLLVAVDEGFASVLWVTNAVTTGGVMQTYSVGPNLTRRPVRLFWTEGQYAGPRVRFGNNYEVKIWYNSQIRDPLAADTNNATYIANEQISLVSPASVFLKNNELRAMANTRGRFVITYSRKPEGGSTNIRELLDFEVVDVLEPMSSTLQAYVGSRLLPNRRDYDINALFCDVIRGGVDETGARPDEIFVYKHTVGRRNGWVWAIRPTEAPWQIEIFWKAKEKLDVIWPFEVDIYSADWNPDSQACALVSGERGGPAAHVSIPQEVSCQVMPYQAVPGGSVPYVQAATAFAKVSGGAFTATQPGLCTLKYTVGDDVWFEPVHTVWENDPLVYQGVRVSSIGEELKPFRANGLAGDGYDQWPGMLRIPVTIPTGEGITNWPGDRWDRYNVGLYAYPDEYPTTEDGLHSQLFAVNVGHLGVWWANPSSLVADEELPVPIYWPSLVCDYRNVWSPRPREVAIASFNGSTCDTPVEDSSGSLRLPGLSAFEASMGLAGDSSNVLSGTTYNEGFLFETWVRAETLEGPRGVMMLSSGFMTNLNFFLQDGTPAVTLICSSNPGNGEYPAVTQTWYAAASVQTGVFTHVALSYRSGTIRFYVNGSAKGTYSDAPVDLAFNVAQGLNIGMLETSYHAYGPYWGFNTWGYFRGWMDEIRLWWGPRTPEEVRRDYRSPLDVPPDNLLCHFNFATNAPGATSFFYPDAFGASSMWLGTGATIDPDVTAPSLYPGKAYPGLNPRIYVQNDDTAAGYNPNEEHALLISGIAYPLRCDLNEPTTSDPFMLVEYSPDASWRRAMDAYRVVATNDLYPDFSQAIEAGKMIQPPAPLRSILPDNCAKTHCDKTDEPFLFRDRKRYLWAQQAKDDGGALSVGMRFFYPNEPGFWYPQFSAGNQPEALREMPWLSALGRTASPAVILDGEPVRVRFDIQWPAIVPTLTIGDTLTKPANGLPAVRGQKSVRIVYQQSLKKGQGDSVVLIDPTRAYKAPLAKVPPNMRAKRDPRTGNIFFSDLDPDLRPRLFDVPNESVDKRLQLKGLFVDYDQTAGYHYLRLNLLTPDLTAMATNPARMTGLDDTWTAAILSLPTNRSEVVNEGTPFDSLALCTPGLGFGYVTLLFNNSTNIDMVDPGNPISMEVIRVDTNLFRGKIDVIQSDNPLDKYLTLRHISDFSGRPQSWAFEWDYTRPNQYGVTDTNAFLPLIRDVPGIGAYTMVFGSSGEFGLADAFVRCRYRALDPAIQSVVGTNWSGWTEGVLCEGWIKRVLKAINPFDQRIRDYMNNALQMDLSMLQQAGQPYAGNVPMNLDAMNEYGLIPIYQTLMEQSRDLSIDSTLDTMATENAVCLALMLAAGRLNDMYMVLGNEAYADALNPTLALGNTDPVLTSDAPSIFAFQGLVPNLLEEELALLRGRDCSAETYPLYTTFPVFNRLPWNFTYDITHGQVAYVLNYGISDLKGDKNGVVDAQDAAILYPQGHGDAWGHYLSAVQAYYDLFRHRNFTWFPQLESIRVGQLDVTMSALHERKFAAAAAAKARTGLAIMDRTYRQRYEEGADESWQVQRDENTNRVWGVGEWGARETMGTYFDWVMANALLPDKTSPTNINPLAVIDRTAVPELNEIVLLAQDAQQLVDMADRGMNPLGLGVGAVPFDISPAEIDQGHTHFEQAYAKAAAALKVARSVFDRVQTCTAALRDQNEARDLDTTVLTQEQTFDRRLIEIYGFPYPDDIGPGKTYPEGYTGPDTEHYYYINRYDFSGTIPLASNTISAQIVVPTVVGGGTRVYDPGEFVNMPPPSSDPTLTLQAVLQFVDPAYAARFADITSRYGSVAGMSGLTRAKVDAANIPELSQLFSEVTTAYDGIQATILGKAEAVVGWFDGVVSAPVDAVDNFLSQWIGPSVSLNPIHLVGPQITYETNDVTFWIGPDGLPMKPTSYTSSRRAEGEVQVALSQYVLALRETTAAIEDSKLRYKKVIAADTEFRNRVGTRLSAYYSSLSGIEGLNSLEKTIEVVNKAVALVDKVYSDGMEVYDAIDKSIPTVAGLSFDIGAVVRGGIRIGVTTANMANTIQKLAQGEKLAETQRDLEIDKKTLDLNAMATTIGVESAELAHKVVDTALDYVGSLSAIDVAMQKAETARMQYSRAIAAGDLVQVEREQARTIWATDLSERRYRNMAYQIFRNDDLARYEETFSMAAKYVYLAAKAYDYETGLLKNDGATGAAGREFLSQIVRARAIGRMASDGTPLPAGPTGDPGLADIMARMDANWSVLKGRLNFNNPQVETGVFSLRKELFRIPDGAAFDAVWQRQLRDHMVSSIQDVPEYRTFCLPFTPSDTPEPGLVIPFATTIDFRKNFFGLPLSAGDNAYDSTHFATKTRSVGVWFTNYRTTLLANQPRVYLIPVGEDMMRVPDGVGETIRSWSILDQALPIPYPLSNEAWMKSDWHVNTDVLGGEFFVRRRYPSLRAYHDDGFDVSQMTMNARLIGRSVWNSRWLLIIPGGTLLSDSQKGIETFVNGHELAPGSGTYDGNGVKDIKLFFQSYSYSGN